MERQGAKRRVRDRVDIGSFRIGENRIGKIYRNTQDEMERGELRRRIEIVVVLVVEFLDGDNSKGKTRGGAGRGEGRGGGRM